MMLINYLLAQTMTEPPEQVRHGLDWFRGLVQKVPTNVWILIICVVVGWIVLRRILSVLLRQIRGSRPPRIHPSLQKYNVDRVELQRRQRELSAAIVTTSTSSRLAGYRLVRQVEAVFVEGFSTPDDALIALKAAAVERGANAIINVRTEHTAAGRSTASGDAVVVAPLTTGPGRVSSPTGSPKPPSQH